MAHPLRVGVQRANSVPSGEGLQGGWVRQETTRDSYTHQVVEASGAAAVAAMCPVVVPCDFGP